MKTLTTNEMVQIYNEYQTTKHNGIKCGLDSLDKIIRMDRKNLAVLTARPNEGKSTFINYYCYMMATNNNWKTLYFNFETDNGRFINDLVKLYGSIENVIRYCVIANISEVHSLRDIYTIIDEQNDINKIDMCVIDPFMRLNTWLSDINTYSIGQTLTELQQKAIDKDILLLIVAHPQKIKDGEPVTPNDIIGSTFFYTVADFIFSLSIVDRENMISEIKTLKIRNNLDMGICGKNCLLGFDPLTKKYSEYNDNDIFDIPFGKQTANNVMKEICSQDNENKATGAVKNNAANILPTEIEQTQQEPQESRFEPLDPHSIKVGVFKRCSINVPYNKISLYDATKLGMEESQRDIIEEIRKVCEEKKDGWEEEKRRLKLQLKCFLPQIETRNRRINSDTIYNNLLAFDIDEKDNSTDINEIREIVKNDPHTYYMGNSASGMGVYGFFIGNGNMKDYESQWAAMCDYMRANYNIILDENAKDITRIRFVSFDNKDYWNYNAVPFEEIQRTEHYNHNTDISNNNLSVPQEHHKLNDSEIEFFLNVIMKDVVNEHLILSNNHNESKAIAYELAYYFGFDGLEYYLTIRKQRGGYDEQKSTANYFQLCKWVYESGFKRDGNMQTIKHFYYNALDRKRVEQNNLYTTGTFMRAN